MIAEAALFGVYETTRRAWVMGRPLAGYAVDPHCSGGSIENPDDLQPTLKRAVARIKKDMPALVDAVTQHR